MKRGVGLLSNVKCQPGSHFLVNTIVGVSASRISCWSTNSLRHCVKRGVGLLSNVKCKHDSHFLVNLMIVEYELRE